MKQFFKTMSALLLVAVMMLCVVACTPPKPQNARLRAIAITKKPTTVTYVAGQVFDPVGMEVTAAYDDGTTAVVTGWTYDKKEPLTTEDDSVKVSYTENEVTKNATLSITVEPGVDHVRYHSFENGVCSCGASMFEAEAGVLSGNPTNGNETFLVTKDTASGGAVVGNWGDGSNKWSAYCSLSAETTAVFGVRITPTGGISSEYRLPGTPDEADRDRKGDTLWPFEMRLNDEIVSWQDTAVPLFGGEDYFEWAILLTNELTLREGDNHLEMEAWDYYGMNFDYVFLNVENKTVTWKTEGETPEPSPVHTHAFDAQSNKCTCGAYKIEAEDCEVTGTPAGWAGEDGFYRKKDNEHDTAPTKVGAWGVNGDNRIKIKFTSDKAYEDVTMLFVIQTGGVVTAQGFDFYFDGERGTGNIDHGTIAAGWSTWQNVRSAAFTVKAGENVMILEAYQNCEVDWDCFVLENLPAEAVISYEKYQPGSSQDPVSHTHVFDGIRCACGALKIEAEDCEVIGTPAGWAGEDGFYRKKDSEHDTAATKVGAWGVHGDNRIYIKFTSDRAYEGVTVTFSVQTGGIADPTGFDFYFNESRGTKIGHDTLSAGIGTWTEIKSVSFDIKQGENFLVIEAYEGNEIDWDYFLFEGLPADMVIGFTPYDRMTKA